MVTNKKGIYDVIFSEILIPITILSGGIAFFLIANVSWKLFPSILLVTVPFGLSCMGSRRISRMNKKEEK